MGPRCSSRFCNGFDGVCRKLPRSTYSIQVLPIYPLLALIIHFVTRSLVFYTIYLIYPRSHFDLYFVPELFLIVWCALNFIFSLHSLIGIDSNESNGDEWLVMKAPSLFE